MSDFVTTDGAPTNMENFQRYLLDISRGGAAGASPSPSQQARMAKATSRARLALTSMSTSSRQPAELDAHYLTTYGLRTVKGANDLRALLKNGLRVKAVVQQQRDRAWVWLQGRNNDGSTYQFSALWRRRGAVWREAIIVAADRRDLPSTFPPPLPLWNLGLQAAFLATTQYLAVAMTCDDPNGVDDAEFLTRELEAAADTITRAVNGPRTPFSDSDLQSLPYLELFDGAPVD